ncbi:hypothetical protein CN092_24195 [Sinorhizobium meliloti]|nr:hypothetical protein CN092_24195 [Sinorhizobium meliloti]
MDLALEFDLLESGGWGSVREVASGAVGREANAVVVGAADHPCTATGLALTVGAIAFAVGYTMGRSSSEKGRSYWR